MIQQLIHHDPANRNLLLIFLGWGCDSRQLASLHSPGCDVMAVWDYRDEAFDPTPLAAYRCVYLFAWSMGVMMAERVAARCPQLHPAVAIAINGSTTPVDDLRGIPRAIFSGTLDGLNEATLSKFQRRMCRNAHEYAAYRAVAPTRPIDELRDELRLLGDRAAEANGQALAWDRAVIAQDDRIFPPANLRRAWQSLPRVRTVAGGHLPDWQMIVDQEIIDKDFVAQKFQNAMPTYNREATVQRQIAQRLWQMWRNALANYRQTTDNQQSVDHSKPIQTIVEAGCGTGLLTRLYAPSLRPRRLLLWDLCPTDPTDFFGLFGLGDAKWLDEADFIVGDAEELIELLPDDDVDAVVSASTMQWFNAPAAFITNACRALAPGGVLLLSTFGERNFRELSAITHLPLRYLSLNELRAALPNGMRTIAAAEEEIVCTFPSPKHVMRHLRATGVNGLRAVNTPLSRLLADYPTAPDGSAPLTYHPIYLLAQKHP